MASEESTTTFTAEDLALVDVSAEAAAEAANTAPNALADKTADAAADKTATDKPADATTDKAASADKAADAKPSVLDTEDDGEAADKDAKPADKSSEQWTELRSKAVDRQMSRIEASLKKTVPAADLPKELEKARTKLSNQLGRYATVEDALLAGFAAQDKIRSGQVKEKLPEDATDAEMSEWRAANGIPESADAYEIAKIDGHQWSQADQTGLAQLKAMAHGLNFTNDQLNGVARVYANLVQSGQEARLEQLDQLDKTDSQATRDTLRDELKGEFKPSLTLVKRMLADPDVFPADLGEQIAGARLPSGKRLINDPTYMRFLIENARERYGEAAMITGQQAAITQSEKDEINKLMTSNIDEYNNGNWKGTGKTPSERMLEIAREESTRGRKR